MTLQDAIINDSRDIFDERGVKAADIERVVSGYPESRLLLHKPRLAVWVDDNWLDVYKLIGLTNPGT
jgi:hypothetical protein